MDWQLKTGQTIRRVDLHKLYGGSGQGGICPSLKSANLFIFTDPSEGEQYGYIDGLRKDGLFHYTGEGQKGNQQMIRGNAAILHHREEGRALRLFVGARGEVRYRGQLEIDSEKPFYHAPAPQLGSSLERKVIIFRLRGVDVEPVAKKDDPPADLVAEVPIENKNTESVLIHPKAEVYAATRLEQRLVHAYRDYIEKSGGQIVRHRMRPSGDAKPLFTDAYNKARNNLIEAKGSVTREAIRMAIGQLADYSRFIKPKPSLAVLLPIRPPNDLEDLLLSQGIHSVWQEEETQFVDNANGLFT